MVHVDDVTFRGKWVFTTKAATINQAPTIKAGNRVLTVGDAFDPLEGVTAEDAEEGTIPMTEKRIEVTVKEKEDAGQENTKQMTLRQRTRNRMILRQRT